MLAEAVAEIALMTDIPTNDGILCSLSAAENLSRLVGSGICPLELPVGWKSSRFWSQNVGT